MLILLEEWSHSFNPDWFYHAGGNDTQGQSKIMAWWVGQEFQNQSFLTVCLGHLVNRLIGNKTWEGGWGWGGGVSGVCVWVGYIHCSSVSATIWALFSGSHWVSGRWLTRWHPGHLNAILGSYQGPATFQQDLSLQKSRHEDHPHLQVGKQW